MNLLLVEDSLADVCLVSTILDEFRPDIRIDHAEDGRVALQRLGFSQPGAPQQALIPYDLVLLDVNMPAMNGLEVLRAMQANPHPPVVVWTSASELLQSGLPLQLGAEGCRIKPFDIRDLEALLLEVTDRWLPRADTALPQ